MRCSARIGGVSSLFRAGPGTEFLRSTTMSKRPPVLPFDAAHRGQTVPVRSARPLFITSQLVLVLIIARRGPSFRGPRFR